MRAVLEIELFREDEYAFDRNLKPWVSRLTGLDENYRFQREFINISQKDYSRANSKGSRGIYIYYILKDGIYEVKRLVDWKRTRRYFIRVDEDRISEISRAEVIGYLENNQSNEKRVREWLKDVN